MFAPSIRPYALGFLILMLSAICAPAQAQVTIVTQDYHIDAVDPGIKLFVRQKMAQGNTRFNDENIVLFEKQRFEFFNEILKFLKD